MKRALFFAFLIGLFFSTGSLQAQQYISCGCSCNWGYWNTGANHTILFNGTTVTLDGVNIVSDATKEVWVGVFYDSLGTLKNAGNLQWTGVSNALTAWGTESGYVNGLASNELMKWKICVKTLPSGPTTKYDATAVYMPFMPNTSNYATNGMSGLTSLTATSALGVAATSLISPTSGCGLSSAQTVQVSFTNNQAGNISGNINLTYSINGGTPATGVFTGGLAAGQTANYTFTQPANLSALGVGNTDSTYQITFTVQMATGTDVNPNDNTMTVAVTNEVPPATSFHVNTTTYPTYPNFCYAPGLAPITLIGVPAGGTFSGDGVSGNYFIPDMAKGMCATCTSFVVTYNYFDAASQCTGSAQGTIYLNTIPTAAINNNDVDLCVFETITVTGSPAGGVFMGSSYLNASTGIFTPAIAQNYNLTYKYTNPTTGCSDTSDVKVFIAHSLPNATINNLHRAYCSDGADVTLQGSPAGGTYSSSTGAVIANGVFKPSQTSVLTHNITYAYTDANGCFDDFSTNVKVFNGNPTLDFTGLLPAYCNDDTSFTLTPVYTTTPSSLSWVGATNAQFSPTTIGSQTVSLTGLWTNVYFNDTAICNNVATHSTIVWALPQVNLSNGLPISNIGSVETAEPDSVHLNAGPGYTYIWSTGQTSQIITTPGYGVYWVTITDNHGCKNSDDLAITGTDLKVAVLASPVSNCEFINPCSTPVTVKVTNPGTYTFTTHDIISFTGRINNDLVQSQTISLGDNTPITSIAPGDTVLFTFNSSLPGCSTLVNPGDYSFKVVAKFVPNTTVFQLPDVQSNNDTLITIVTNGGLPVVDLGADITTGSPDTITLNAGDGFVSYLWTAGSPGAVDQIITVPLFFGDEEYCVEVVDVYGCETSDCIVIYNGIDELASSYELFNVYPNPSHGSFFVDMSNRSNQPVSFEILDAQGKLVKRAVSQQTSQFTKEFDVRDLPKGLYSIRAYNGVDYVSAHILIQ